MIINFDKELAVLREAGVVIPDDKVMAVAVELLMVFDKGFVAGRDHAVRIVQRKATKPRFRTSLSARFVRWWR